MDFTLCIALFNLLLMIIILMKKKENRYIYSPLRTSRLILFEGQENNYIIPHSCEQFNLSDSPSQDE